MKAWIASLICLVTAGTCQPGAETSALVIEIKIPEGCHLTTERFSMPEDPEHPNTPFMLVCEESAGTPREREEP